MSKFYERTCEQISGKIVPRGVPKDLVIICPVFICKELVLFINLLEPEITHIILHCEPFITIFCLNLHNTDYLSIHLYHLFLHIRIVTISHQIHQIQYSVKLWAQAQIVLLPHGSIRNVDVPMGHLSLIDMNKSTNQTESPVLTKGSLAKSVEYLFIPFSHKSSQNHNLDYYRRRNLPFGSSCVPAYPRTLDRSPR